MVNKYNDKKIGACFAEVIVPPLNEPFLYSVPESLSQQIQTGSRVKVPLGRRVANGYVIHSAVPRPSDATYTIKPIKELHTDQLCFAEAMLPFYRWIANYYCASLGVVLEAAIPENIPSKVIKRWYAKDVFDSSKLRGNRQKEIFQSIRDEGEDGIDHGLLIKKFPHSSAILKRLSGLEALFHTAQTESPVSYLEHSLSTSEESISLTQSQQKAYDKIALSHKEESYQSFLLHGVTGSGKTEVYIEAARNVLKDGGGVLILVPEIALTPQLIDRFRKKLQEPIALLHSSLNRRKRWESWRALLSGECRVALGARSSIFAPVSNLKVIIVDEEHDSSYKQGDGLRYNARDLALVRGSLQKASVILGSATPSMESFYNASREKHQYLRLKERPFQTAALSYEVVNLNRIKRTEMPSKSISPNLYEAIKQAIENEQQVFLLYNRRGFARYMQCRTCGEVVFCPNCSVPLSYHQVIHSLLCHYCSFSTTPAKHCGECSKKPAQKEEPLLELRGSGTQKIVEELETLFPDAKIGRLDRDSATKLDNLEKILQAVRDREIQILAGTQMIAKGHDLPGVTLVGVIDCDVGINMPDFRASERVFQLLTQAGGRAGRRDQKGKVILQTRIPHHPSITYTTKEDFHEFAKRELTLRKQLLYPPFSKIVRIVASATQEEAPLQFLHSVKQEIDRWCPENGVEAICLGPAKAPIEKVKALYRSHLILRGQSSSELRKLVTILKKFLKPPKEMRVTYDVDPLDML